MGWECDIEILTNRSTRYTQMFHKSSFFTAHPSLYCLGFGGGTLLWMALIFYLSSLPYQVTPKSASIELLGDISAGAGEVRSYVAHVMLYGVLTALIAASIWAWKFGYQFRLAVFAVVIAALYGLRDEYHQTFVAGRSATLADVFMNFVGAAIAAAGLWVFFKLFAGRPMRG